MVDVATLHLILIDNRYKSFISHLKLKFETLYALKAVKEFLLI